MNTIIRKAIASSTLAAVVIGSFTTAAFAAYTELAAAEKLADAGVISAQSDAAGYELGRNLERQELVGIAGRVKGVVPSTPASDHVYQGVFSDLPSNSADADYWVTRAAELAANNGIVSDANSEFNPKRLVTNYEALVMTLKASCVEPTDASGASHVDQTLARAAELGVNVADANAYATRGEAFQYAAAFMEEAANNPSELNGDIEGCEDLACGEFDGLLEDVTIDTVSEDGVVTGTADAGAYVMVTITNGASASASAYADEDGDYSVDVDVSSITTGEADVDVVSTLCAESTASATADIETETTSPIVEGDLAVSVSSDTPDSATVPGAVNGLPVAKFDFTAGEDDVTVTQVTLKRTGLSDEDTIEALAIFTDEGRVSNDKNDNQENDTEAQISLNSGGVVVAAGTTVTLTVVADLGSESDASNDEFALQVVDVAANADVEGLGATSNTFKIGSVDAPEITITNGSSVSDPKLGENGADIFEFEVEGASDEDVILMSITFEGSSDAEDDLMNFELHYDNEVVATATSMNDDYLTFDLGDGITIEEDKNEDFTVVADIIEGASDDIEFRIDQALDVTAESTKFGYGAAVDISDADEFGELGSITIEAGELTIVEIEAEFDEIREDKDNVVLGMIKVTNVAGQNLELQEFGVRFDIDAGSTGFGQATDFFDDVELYSEDTGSSYELTVNGSDDLDVVFSEDDIDVTLPQGTTTWAIRVDTADDITDFDTASFELSFTTGSVNSVDGGFYVEETQDDEEVEDITPSSISFNTIDGSESGAEVSLVPLANTTVVRGADDVVFLQFEVEAEEASDIVIDEIAVYVESDGAGDATNQEVSDVRLFQGSVSESNEIDVESGSNLGSGVATFDDFSPITVDANETEVFVVTVSFVDGQDAVDNSDYYIQLVSIDIEDDENDDVTANGDIGDYSGREITVTDAGTISTLALDDANEDNEFDKLGLAGDSLIIASFDVRADNEEVDVEEIVFSITGATGDLEDTVISASLLLDGVVVDTNSNSDIDSSEIRFEDIAGLVIPENTSELALQLNTANIGEDETGLAQTGLQVTMVEFTEMDGVDSGKDVADADSGVVASKTLDIVSAVVTPSVVSTFGTDDQTSEIRLVVDGGDNTTAVGDAVQAELAELTFEVTSFTTAGDITVFNGNGDQIGTVAVAAAGNFSVDVTDDSIGSDNEVYRVETTAEATFRLAKDGVEYDVVGGATGITTKLENTLEIGQYADSN